MKLFLMRHGQAVSTIVDPQRPLSGRGNAEVKQVAEYLKAATFRANPSAPIQAPAVFHSSKLRARQSAKILTTILFPGVEPAERTGLAPNDPAEAWLPELAATEGDLMLVGHLPFLGRLAGLLLADDATLAGVQFPTAAVACLERRQERWTLAWMVHPAMAH